MLLLCYGVAACKSSDKPHGACHSFDQMFVPGPLKKLHKDVLGNKKSSCYDLTSPHLCTNWFAVHTVCVLTIRRQITGSKFSDLHSTHSQTIWGCAKHRKASCTTQLLVVAKHRVAQPSAGLHFHSSVHRFRPVYTVLVFQVLLLVLLGYNTIPRRATLYDFSWCCWVTIQYAEEQHFMTFLGVAGLQYNTQKSNTLWLFLVLLGYNTICRRATLYDFSWFCWVTIQYAEEQLYNFCWFCWVNIQYAEEQHFILLLLFLLCFSLEIYFQSCARWLSKIFRLLWK